MKRQSKRLATIALATTAITLIAFTFAFWRIEHPVSVSQFEVTVAVIPLGVTTEEADKMIGSPPDVITKQDGVLVTPVTMLTASNGLAKQYGPPQTYSLRVWDRDGVKATVAVDREGKVAGHWTWR